MLDLKKGLPIEEWNEWICARIQGSFWINDMRIIKEEIEKLTSGQIYLEVGVDEGKSLSTAAYYAPEGVYTVGVDYIDPPARAPYMKIRLGHFPKGESLISLGSKTFYMQADANELAKIWNTPLDLLFIDGDHSYEGVKNDTLSWEPKVKEGGTILFHDYDSLPVKEWLDEHYGKNKEVLHGKIVRVRK